jgi:hypothetical protein
MVAVVVVFGAAVTVLSAIVGYVKVSQFHELSALESVTSWLVLPVFVISTSYVKVPSMTLVRTKASLM